MSLQKFIPECSLTPRGLENASGMHCYWNSVLQALMSTTAFTQLILKLDTLPEIHNSSFVSLFAKFIREELTNMELFEKYILALYTIGKDKQQLQELISDQQCVSETLSYILEIFEKCRPIVHLFQHRYFQSLICFECKHLSNSKATNIVFEISPDQQVPESLLELVEEIHDYKCEKCGVANTKQKINKLVMIPEVISIVIKKYIWEHGTGKKTNDSTVLPEFITIDKFNYRAVAYINHYGEINSGHYITTALRQNNSELMWFRLNDNVITMAQYAPGPNTYMIVYNYYE